MSFRVGISTNLLRDESFMSLVILCRFPAAEYKDEIMSLRKCAHLLKSNRMAEARAEDDDFFIYIGGDQQVPIGVRHARIHRDVKIIPRRAFHARRNLIYVEFHDDIEIIEKNAFAWCTSLRNVKLLGVKIIKTKAFFICSDLTDVEFGDKLGTIERSAFHNCTSLRKITMPSVRTIGK